MSEEYSEEEAQRNLEAAQHIDEDTPDPEHQDPHLEDTE